MTKSIPCKLCQSMDRKLLFKDTHPFVKCRNCGFIFIDHAFTPEEIDDMYSEDYFHQNDYIENITGRTYIANKYLTVVEQYIKKGRLLDVGCAGGVLLKLAKEHGFEVQGVEISEYATNVAKEMGIDVKNSTLEDANFDPRSFDVIILLHVLEHLTDPLETLQEANRILKDDGIMVIDVPNVNMLGPKVRELFYNDVTKSYDEGFFKLPHLNFFSPDTLTRMCKEAGFEVVSLKSRLIMKYLAKILKAGKADKQMSKSIRKAELENKKSATKPVYNLIKWLDRTKMGNNLTAVLRKQ